ncbi:MAG TPA: ethanolamine utilization microcompartment protein EutL [Polyangia bacterium]|jgi:ethanolamine utilization protein EutL
MAVRATDATSDEPRGLGLVDLPPLKPRVLAVRTIPRVDEQLAAEWKLPDGLRAAGMLTCSSDDALFVALDEGTKAAPVEVVYARSFYAGSSYPSGPLSGEAIGVYAARDPDEVRAALDACVRTLEKEAWFYAADEKGELAFFPHVVRATGSYLSREAGIAVGAPLAYLIAPPLESMVAFDAALKAAAVRVAKWFGPPTETNYGGGYLVGDLPACEAAARAFAAAVVDIARAPTDVTRAARGGGEALGARPKGGKGAGKYRVLATGERLSDKPEHLTHLHDDESLVDKSHPRLPLRGKLDTLQGLLLDAQCAADADGARGLVGELGEALELTRAIVGAEVTGRPLASWKLAGLGANELRYHSHHTHELYGVPFMFPSVRQGPVVARLYTARAYAREAELALYLAFPSAGDEGRADLKLAMNRLSSALYLMTIKYVGGKYAGEHLRPGPVKGWKPPKQKADG